MIAASIYGYLGADPESKTTQNGKAMTIARIAVNATKQGAPANTLWVSVLAFGNSAAALLSAKKGQSVAAMGKLSRSYYHASTGDEKESWSLMADAVMVPNMPTATELPAQKYRDWADAPGKDYKPKGKPINYDDEEIPF